MGQAIYHVIYDHPIPHLATFTSASSVRSRSSTLSSLLLKMYSSAIRARMATSFVARRGFSTTRTQLGSPYHYAEGPRTNIPFNPLTKHFFWRYWAFMITGFGTPFAIAVWQTYKTK
ncbi:hypothetical protein N7517_005375 [Penicillium concentricum]|uniref:Cytochrome c oxidase subunit 8, mitochondrial n=1 Tax=Penicillium concentricum TaxID=293559 RepID=A0A9W9SA21_9EURO|nr:uncharacterized protein N7517_005375 [Penicillium concentricum]KAJ5373369.1 hypothetical protein N7517_005375 [Penicillium concentricum]